MDNSASGSSDINIIKRGRGKVLLHNGHQYYVVKTYKNAHSIWRCRNYKQKKCSGTITIAENLLLVLKTMSHSSDCLPSENKNIVSSIISSSIETAASNIEDTVHSIYKKTVASMMDKGIEKLPSYDNYRVVANRRRKRFLKTTHLVHTDLKKVEVPPAYNNFLLGDYNSEDNRILIFASNEARRELLKVGKIFFADGTFKRCPRPFMQLYVIFCDIGSDGENNNVVPVVYALLPNKTKKTYSLLFDIIKKQIPEWVPHQFITDFEQAAISALKVFFPEMTHHGCFYHFQEKLKRKAKRLKIIQQNKQRSSNKIISLCMVLPHLPEGNIEEGFDYIKKESEIIGKSNNLLEFLSYVENYWMPKKSMWCVFGQRHRTNNVSEGWNGQFNKSFNRRPTIAHLLKILRDDATFHAVNAITKEPAKKRCKTVIDRNAYILHVQMQLVNLEIDVPLFLEKLRS